MTESNDIDNALRSTFDYWHKRIAPTIKKKIALPFPDYYANSMTKGHTFLYYNKPNCNEIIEASKAAYRKEAKEWMEKNNYAN